MEIHPVPSGSIPPRVPGLAVPTGERVPLSLAAMAMPGQMLRAATLAQWLAALGFRVVDLLEVRGRGGPSGVMANEDRPCREMTLARNKAVGHLVLSPLVIVHLHGSEKVAWVARRFSRSSSQPAYDRMRHGPVRDNLIDLGADIRIAYGLVKGDRIASTGRVGWTPPSSRPA